MSALTVDPGPANGYGWEDLVRLWEEMEWPEGCKVEIIEGIITVSPPPSNDHNSIANVLQRRLYSVIPEDWGIYQTLGVSVPMRDGMFIPDLAVLPCAALDRPGYYVPAGEALFVAEITSKSNARQDRLSKPAGYAQAGVPLYLLIDSWAPGGPTVTLYGEPAGDVYRTLHAGKFGEPVHLPKPFDITVETGEFPVS